MFADSPTRTGRLATGWKALILLGLLIVVGIWSSRWILRTSQFAREREQGLMLANQGNLREAEPLLRQTLERNSADLEVLRVLASAHSRQNNEEAALPLLQQWLDIRPGDLEPITIRFRLRIRLRLHEDALADAEFLAEQPAIETDLYLHVADVLRRAGKAIEAERVAEKGLGALPGDPGLRVMKAELLHELGNSTAASSLLEETTRENPGFVSAWRAAGLVWLARGEPDRAIICFERAISLDPREPSLRFHLACALLRAGRDAEGQREMQRYEKMRTALDLASQSYNQPHKIDLALRAARSLYDAELDDQARLIVNQILERDPGNKEAEALRNRPRSPNR